MTLLHFPLVSPVHDRDDLQGRLPGTPDHLRESCSLRSEHHEQPFRLRSCPRRCGCRLTACCTCMRFSRAPVTTPRDLADWHKRRRDASRPMTQHSMSRALHKQHYGVPAEVCAGKVASGLCCAGCRIALKMARCLLGPNPPRGHLHHESRQLRVAAGGRCCCCRCGAVEGAACRRHDWAMIEMSCAE